ncbi:Rha family transcriptional regulator [Polycladidibacter stylochi]|uniref:Rha family transcriptional regulator n=1 Tax=Polycladidibacter stylochi TaxID=1807766 RepID=UPI00082BDC5D|nr:Rha family transcriptional regulator [Pseudovibrio stylochi]
MHEISFIYFEPYIIRMINRPTAPLFMVSDISRVLGYYSSIHLRRRLAPEQRHLCQLPTRFGLQTCIFTDVVGLEQMFRTSHKPRTAKLAAFLMGCAQGRGQPPLQVPQSMSSREIAERCNKQHKHVIRDIEKMLDDLSEDRLKFEHISKDSYGRDQKSYLLPKDLTLTLVTGYNVKLRKAIIDRWQQLEEQAWQRHFAGPSLVLDMPAAHSELQRKAAAYDKVAQLLGEH